MGKRGPKPRILDRNSPVDCKDELQGIDRDKLRLIPTVELNRLIERQKVILKEKEELLNQIRATRKIEFFKPVRVETCKCGSEMVFDWTRRSDKPGWGCPNCKAISNEGPPYQVRFLEFLNAGKKIITLQGANGIGKSLMGAVSIGAACLGIQPWDRKETIWGRRPVKCRILCTDWEKHADTVIVPELKKWLPVGEYKTDKNNLSIESKFNFKNGSTIELVTCKQSTPDLEGWQGDLVWADEPFPRDKFVALLRGLRKAKEDLDEDDPEMGVFLITMTAVSEAWILDDIVRKIHPQYASVTEIPMDANPYLSKQYQETYAESLKENEKIPRIYGGWLNLIGLVWSGFKPDIHVIDDFIVPTDWPVVVFIDFHTRTPQAISFYTTDPQERWYVIDEEFKHFSPEETADFIIRKKFSNAWRIDEVFIDPFSKGDAGYVKNRFGDVPDSFSIIKERLSEHGIDLIVASKDKASGILNVEKMLMGPNKMPILFFFRSLCNKIKDEGIIWEIQRWNYDENQEPKDENDHFCENLYRMTLTGIKYTKIQEETRTSELDFDVFADDYGKKESRSYL